MRIGELAKRTETLVETIRFYEHAGVLAPPARTLGGYRNYASGDIQRLTFIRRCRELGFSLDEVRGLLKLADRSNDSCSSVCEVASKQLDEVLQKLARLRRLERSLSSLKNSCDGGRIRDCRILESLMS
jgi:DNA-binding transcriptional MerR regulator